MQSAPSGKTVTIPVTIANPTNSVQGIDLTLQYNSNEMTLATGGASASVVEGNWSSANGLLMTDDVTQVSGTGTVYASLYYPGSGSSTTTGGTASPNGMDVVDLHVHSGHSATAGVYPLTIQTGSINDGGVLTSLASGTFTVPIGVSMADAATGMTGGASAGYTSPEGSAITATGTTVVAEAPGTLTHHWTVTSTNPQSVPAQNLAGNNTSFTFTPSNVGTYTITDTVTDAAGDTGTATTTVNVTEVLPVVTIVGPTLAAEGSTQNYTFTTVNAGRQARRSLSGRLRTRSGQLRPQRNDHQCRLQPDDRRG